MPKRTLLASLLMLAVAGVFAALYRPGVSPHHSSTEPITKESQTGGRIAQGTPENKDTSDSAQPAAPAHDAPVKKIDTVTNENNSPSKTTTSREYPYRALQTTNDPYVASSYAFSQLNAPTAWDITTGGNVIVADIDTGFALDHEDLQDSWYRNSSETGMTASDDTCWTGTPTDKTSNNCDDDENGYVDDWRGWDFYGHPNGSGGFIRDNNPQAGAINPNGQAAAHGTETAGLIGATANNGKGLAGFNWNVKIMPLQALSDNGDGITSDVVDAIYYAVDNGAKVINMSLGGEQSDAALASAIDYAFSKNVLVVAAAGNCGQGCIGADGTTSYPAGTMAYPALNNHVVAVGAVDETGKRATFSSYGPGLDVVAPGSVAYSGTILASTAWSAANPTSAYVTRLYGTSFAAPIVSSLAALIIGAEPTATPDEVTAYLDGSAQKVAAMNGALYHSEYGHGLVDARMAATVEAGLMGATTPSLSQTGSYVSEHTYTTTSSMSSGCTAAASSYCTIRLVNSQTGYDRYLPYKQTNLLGQAGWSWNASMLGSGEWLTVAVSGPLSSSSNYYLFAK